VLCLLGVFASAAACSAGGDDDASVRPAMTNETTNDRSNATGVGNMTSPGTGASTGTGASSATPSGRTNTVPAMGTPVGAAADGVNIGPGGPATSGVTSSNGDSDATVSDASDAGAPLADAGADAVAEADAAAPDADAGQADAGAAIAEALDDGQIVTVVEVLNASEVEQAQAVLPRLQNDAVRAFAQIMIEEHQTARNDLATLAGQQQIALANSDVADQLRLESQQTQGELAGTDAAALDAAYLGAQVTAHQEAEALLGDLSAAADSPELAAQLGELRLNVQGHLQSASALLGSLQNGAL
jgi:putative membrane protein